MDSNAEPRWLRDMKGSLLGLYVTLRDSFWFVPTIMAVAALVAGLLAVWLDHDMGHDWISNDIWIFWAGTASGGRSVMSVIATSNMTVVSIVYSLTISTLSQTSSHFGPRVLRNFTADRGNQIVLGTFVATFVFCLIVMRSINAEDEQHFVPFISVNLGILLGLASLGVLIYYIHHISQSIQAENLISGIGHEFENAVPNLFPKDIGVPKEIGMLPDDPRWHTAYEAGAHSSGYIIGLNAQRLIDLAAKHDVVVRVEKRPGAFAACGVPVLRIFPAENITKELVREFVDCYSWGIHRTPDQDMLYSVQQLSEIAAHALSPGINEPFTAISCIDWLGAALRRIALENPPALFRADRQGKLRAVIEHTSFAEAVRNSFDQIRLYGSSNPKIMHHLISTFGDIVRSLQRDEDCRFLLAYLELTLKDAEREIQNRDDLSEVGREAAIVREALLDQQAGMSTYGG